MIVQRCPVSLTAGKKKKKKNKHYKSTHPGSKPEKQAVNNSAKF